jgi:hypothetical protein
MASDFDRRAAMSSYRPVMQIIRRFLALWAPEAPPRESEPAPDIDADAPVCERLKARWVREGADPRPPESPERVQHVFRALGVEATPDVIEMYGVIGGMDAWDNALWMLWPLDRVAEQAPSSEGVLFSDYCLDCWQYRLRPISAEESAVYVDCDGKPPRLVAFTLKDFFENYLADADALMAR